VKSFFNFKEIYDNPPEFYKVVVSNPTGGTVTILYGILATSQPNAKDFISFRGRRLQDDTVKLWLINPTYLELMERVTEEEACTIDIGMTSAYVAYVGEE